MAGGIAVERDAFGIPGVQALTLTHAGKFNAMSRSMWAELKAIFTAVQQDPAARCVVLQGDQGHFCAGGDIAEYPAFRFDAMQLRRFHEHEVWGGLQAMLDCDVPIIARIEGNCMGAGLEIASCCDVRLAATGARFGAPIARLGFPMAPREAALVTQVAGATLSRAMLLAAELFDAPAMHGHGFLTRVLATDELDASCRDMALRIASLAPLAARMNKQALRQLSAPHQPGQSALQADAYAYADSAEHREGIAAFLAKRPPVFEAGAAG